MLAKSAYSVTPHKNEAGESCVSQKNRAENRTVPRPMKRLKLERDFGGKLRNSHVRCSIGECPVRRRRRSLGRDDLSEKWRVGVGIRRAIVRVVKPVVGVESQLEADALRDPEGLPQAHVASQEAGAAESVASHD